MKSLLATLLLISSPYLCLATHLAPWYSRDLELLPEISYAIQSYATLDQGGHSHAHSSLDHFVHLSLASSYTAWAGEAEILLTGSRARKFGFDTLLITGRYQIWSDLIGDPVSATVGVTLSQTIKEALYDPSSFHHGLSQAELHCAIGKEQSCRDFWLNRCWTAVRIGLADRGSPWLRSIVRWEKNSWNSSVSALFLEGLIGLGQRNLTHNRPFRGYGSIQHRSLDIGAEYLYCSTQGWYTSIRYCYRLLARNFPERANQFELNLFLPFGL